MAKLARGSRGIQSASQRTGSGKFTPTIRWKEGETKFIQFLTPIEEVFIAYYHGFMVVGYREDGSKIYRNFISPKSDADADGNIGIDWEAEDPIWDRFELAGRKRAFAYAVELEAITAPGTSRSKKKITGFEVASREYTDKEGNNNVVPALGLIEQSPSSFFGWLDTFANTTPIEDVVFSITRRGKGTDTRYDFFPVGDALSEEELNIPDGLVVDLEEYINSMMMSEEDIRMLNKLPDDHVLNEYAERAKKKRGGDSYNSRPSSNKASSRTARDDDDDDDDSGDEDGGSSSAERFAQLRRNMANRS